MANSFSDIGIKFPLFSAPIACVADYQPEGLCLFSGRMERHCIALGIGDDLVLPCPDCGTHTLLSVYHRDYGDCPGCGGQVLFPDNDLDAPILVSARSLMLGKVALWRETEFGLVSADTAQEGLTGGVPGLESDWAELVEAPEDHDTDDDAEAWEGWEDDEAETEADGLETPEGAAWGADREAEARASVWEESDIATALPPPPPLRRARIASEQQWRLLTTPRFHARTQSVWLWHCGAPMIYRGPWSRTDFAAQAEGSAALALFRQACGTGVSQAETEAWWDGLEVGGPTLAHTFQCEQCQTLRVWCE